MEKEKLTLKLLVDEICKKSNVSLQYAAEYGRDYLEIFLKEEEAQKAVQEAIFNMTNPSYKISKHGPEVSTLIFISTMINIINYYRNELHKVIPPRILTQDKIEKIHNETSRFYTPYTYATIFCAESGLTTLSDIINSLSEFRYYFMRNSINF